MQYPLPFTKLTGTGNDFILIDNRNQLVDVHDLAAFARAVCRRRFSVGADGLILIENSDRAHFRWRFFNADGSVAEMCGNGARCAARFAFEKGIAPADMAFETGAGLIKAQVLATGVKVALTRPVDLCLNRKLLLEGEERVIHSINTGVPHAVHFVEDLAACPVFSRGRTLRFHEAFAPAGTNANFVRLLDRHALAIRTYERGVEDETMACGTGSVAAAIIATVTGQTQSPVRVTTAGGQQLVVHFTLTGTDITDVFLEGSTGLIYEGLLTEEALKTGG